MFRRQPDTNLLICSWVKILYESEWNLNVSSADQSSQVSSVTFVNIRSVALVLFQQMLPEITVPRNALHAIREK
jgi:hypothetical protein